MRKLLALVIQCAVIVSPLAAWVALLDACTPQSRHDVKTVVDVTAPAACALLTIIAPDGSPAGLVCSDVHGILDRLLASTPARTVALASGSARACTPRPLPMPGRDVREFVCAERLADVDVRRALEIGRAR